MSEREERSRGTGGGQRPRDEIEQYAGGEIKARHGHINGWLIAVYVVLFIWALYYGYVYWGGLGPGLDY